MVRGHGILGALSFLDLPLPLSAFTGVSTAFHCRSDNQVMYYDGADANTNGRSENMSSYFDAFSATLPLLALPLPFHCLFKILDFDFSLPPGAFDFMLSVGVRPLVELSFTPVRPSHPGGAIDRLCSIAGCTSQAGRGRTRQPLRPPSAMREQQQHEQQHEKVQQQKQSRRRRQVPVCGTWRHWWHWRS